MSVTDSGVTLHVQGALTVAVGSCTLLWVDIWQVQVMYRSTACVWRVVTCAKQWWLWSMSVLRALVGLAYDLRGTCEQCCIFWIHQVVKKHSDIFRIMALHERRSTMCIKQQVMALQLHSQWTAGHVTGKRYTTVNSMHIVTMSHFGEKCVERTSPAYAFPLQQFTKNAFKCW